MINDMNKGKAKLQLEDRRLVILPRLYCYSAGVLYCQVLLSGNCFPQCLAAQLF